jgi:hypothetical protein
MDGVIQQRRATQDDTSPEAGLTRLVQPLLLLALIVLGDVLLWGASPGVSLALFGMLILGAALILNKGRGWGGGIVGALMSLPLVEQAQTLSVLFWLAGLLLAGAWIARGGWCGLRDTSLSALRLALFGAAASLLDGIRLIKRNTPGVTLPRGLGTLGHLTRLGTGWALPLGLGFIFVSLLIEANPVAQVWIERAEDMRLPDPTRFFLWAGIGLFVWPFLRLAALRQRLTPSARQTLIGPRQLPAILNPDAVRRSLILFNLIFAMQTGLDVAYLWGGAALPEGLSYAQYAHRGAYPLLVTALLAGGFALVARPFTGTDPLLRGALMFWLVQTVLLVASSLMRLELYVEAYGLTRLRMAAGIWMAVVATGLGLTIWQVLRHHSAGWLLKRCAVLGMVTLYSAMFLSFDRTIARYNLTHDVTQDPYYICTLGPAALPEIRAHDPGLCDYYSRMRAPLIVDWREWGFRDWRVLRSLAALNATRESQVTWPTF